jgi:hypothetical protein
MNKVKALLLVGTVLFGLVNAQAQSQPQPAMRIRGAVTGFDNHELQVKTREGKDLKVNVTDNTKINVLSTLRMSDIRQGSFVGVTAIQNGPEHLCRRAKCICLRRHRGAPGKVITTGTSNPAPA